MLIMVLNEVMGSNEKVSVPKTYVVNEIIKLMGHKVLRSVISDIPFHKRYSMMADETRDVSNREQLVVTMHWVSETYEINKDFSGCILRLMKQPQNAFT